MIYLRSKKEITPMQIALAEDLLMAGGAEAMVEVPFLTTNLRTLLMRT